MPFGGRRSEDPAGRGEGQGQIQLLSRTEEAAALGQPASRFSNPLPLPHIWKILACAQLVKYVIGSQLPRTLTSSSENTGGKLGNFCF